MKWPLWLTLAPAFALLAACDPHQVQQLQEGEGLAAGIVGGQAVTQKDPLSKFVVMITNDYSVRTETNPITGSSKRVAKSTRCTGTIIEDDVILTAAHCLGDDPQMDKIKIWPSLSPYVDLNVKYHEAVDYVHHADYNYYWDQELKFQNDLVLIRFKAKLPKGYGKASITKLSTSIDDRPSEVTLVGYGIATALEEQPRAKTAEDTDYDAIKRVNWGQLKKVPNKKISDNNYRPEQQFVVFDQTDLQGICGGDSGGAVFQVTKKGATVVGVNAGVMTYSTVLPKERGCEDLGVYVDLRYYKEWIKESLAELRSRQ